MLQDAPRCSKMSPRGSQDGPKRLPRWPQEAPRGEPKTFKNMFFYRFSYMEGIMEGDGGKTAQDGGKMAQDGHKLAQDGSKLG